MVNHRPNIVKIFLPNYVYNGKGGWADPRPSVRKKERLMKEQLEVAQSEVQDLKECVKDLMDKVDLLLKERK